MVGGPAARMPTVIMGGVCSKEVQHLTVSVCHSIHVHTVIIRWRLLHGEMCAAQINVKNFIDIGLVGLKNKY